MNGNPPIDLPHNKYAVLNMFHSTMKKLDKNPVKRDQYKEVHLNEIMNNFIEPVPVEELNDPSVRMHFCIIILFTKVIHLAQHLAGRFLMHLSVPKEIFL